MSNVHPTRCTDGASEMKVLKINNRRYLGSKYKLLPFIKKIVGEQCPGIHTVADILQHLAHLNELVADDLVVSV